MLHLFINGCFFLSGAVGLVYQVLWLRMMDKVFGGSPFAVAAVLSIFMLTLSRVLSRRFEFAGERKRFII